MEVLSELITGEMLDGRPTELDVQTILSRVVAVVNPLGNPDGRNRTPTEAFDDSFTFIEGCYYWNGKLRGDDDYYKGPRRFNRSEYDFDPEYPIGLRYEQVDEDVFSDPWNDPAATLEENPTTMARLAKAILGRHQVYAIVDLHSTPRWTAFTRTPGQPVFRPKRRQHSRSARRSVWKRTGPRQGFTSRGDASLEKPPTLRRSTNTETRVRP